MRSNLELWEIVRDNFDRYWDGKNIDGLCMLLYVIPLNIITEEKLIIIKKMKNLGFTLKEMSCISGVTISTIHSRLNSLENIK